MNAQYQKKIIQECETKKVTPVEVNVMGLGDFFIMCGSELDMYRLWDHWNGMATKGWSENLKSWYVHVITPSAQGK